MGRAMGRTTISPKPFNLILKSHVFKLADARSFYSRRLQFLLDQRLDQDVRGHTTERVKSA